MWYNYSNITIPEPPEGEVDFKVDVLTTYFPGEPYQMIITTLEAMLDISYPHETFLCDEANDPYLKKFCQENGIIHVTRDNRVNAKAGNINNALKTAARGDICVVLDPDHIPTPDFLDPILPYFNDPTTGFVQIVQSYYNIDESLVARGAAEQTFQFYGPVMMTLNSYNSVNAIGANCVFRRAALDSIGGHAPGLCEDMHTAMLLYSKGWKGVYLPIVRAKGLAPSNLTSFFKQQLKWSRGSFDLLVKVYPKIFNKLSLRQKLHYALLPMHYLSGLICFINFLIPILALFLTTTPWRGNIVEFALVILPVIASSMLIRTYIQKWIIEKKERGFHLVGGLLHINTWWIHLLGLFYTIVDKKIPYLPTPKESEWATNLKIIIPNAIVAFISIIAIIYGLNEDMTPFSLVMAGFAFFNACIMAFGIYVAIKATNQNNILKNILDEKIKNTLLRVKSGFLASANFAFHVSRILALPLLLLVLIVSMSFKQQKTREKWEEVTSVYYEKESPKYLGIFQPAKDDGQADLETINVLESREGIDFDIISYYLAWNEESIGKFPHRLTQSIFDKDAIPMITWEPWASGLPVSDTVPQLKEEKKIFKYISLGYYDEYLKDFSDILKSYDKPFFIRFAHEFDNPQYPWSYRGDNTPEEFIAAWKYVYTFLKKENAHKAIMVWNPWKSEAIPAYYPGDDYIDWIGLTTLNYDYLNSNRRYMSFQDLYEPFHHQIDSIADQKPVMLAEFGSLDLEGRQREWITNAIRTINEQYEEIQSVVLFNSAYDKNIPENDFYTANYLDWTMDSVEVLNKFSDERTLRHSGALLPDDHPKNNLPEQEIRGIRYKKNINWRQNYYSLTKKEIQRDIALLKEANINTILFNGGNIYDYNILKFTEENNLNVLYSFDVDFSIDFLRNDKALEDRKQEILEKVENYSEKNNVIGYVFSGHMENYFQKPELFSQRSAYFKWLKSVGDEIKAIDPDTPIILELKLNSESSYLISRLYRQLPVDAFGLLIEDETKHLTEVLTNSRKEGIPVFVSSLNSRKLTEETHRFRDVDVVLQNWQDERYFNKITYDGIIDFEGRKKWTYKAVQNTWTDNRFKIESTIPSILKPAELLYSGNSATYNAVLYDGRSWITSPENGDYSFEWSLVKKDSLGTHMALKKLGRGSSITIEIPEDYKQFELLLTVQPTGSDYVMTARSSLHTPAGE